MQTQRGFTLIEIMIALAVLAVVAAIAIQAYRGHIAEARIGTAIKDIRQAEVILDDLASDANLGALDANNTTVRGLYLLNGDLVLDDPASTPAGAVQWLDPWDRIYRYQRNGTDGVRTDGGGNVSNTAAGSLNPQAYDVFSLGPDGTANNGDDVVRGCNGSFLGLHSDHPTC